MQHGGFRHRTFPYVGTKNGTVLSGQTTNSIVLPSVTAADAGSYSVTVIGNCNSVTNGTVLVVNFHDGRQRCCQRERDRSNPRAIR